MSVVHLERCNKRVAVSSHPVVRYAQFLAIGVFRICQLNDLAVMICASHTHPRLYFVMGALADSNKSWIVGPKRCALSVVLQFLATVNGIRGTKLKFIGAGDRDDEGECGDEGCFHFKVL